MTMRRLKRLKTHGLIALVSISAVGLLDYILPPIHALYSTDEKALQHANDTIFRLSLGSGYVSMLLLLVTLLLGVWHLWQKNRS